MKLFVKIMVSLVVGTLIGLLYAYENPDHEYYKVSFSKKTSIEPIIYEDYQLIKKENQRIFGYKETTPIFRKDVININRVLLVGGISFIGMMLIMTLFQSVEHRLKTIENA